MTFSQRHRSAPEYALPWPVEIEIDPASAECVVAVARAALAIDHQSIRTTPVGQRYVLGDAPTDAYHLLIAVDAMGVMDRPLSPAEVKAAHAAMVHA